MMPRLIRGTALFGAVLALVVAGCSSDDEANNAAASPESSAANGSPTAPVATAEPTAQAATPVPAVAATGSPTADFTLLPERRGPRRETTGAVPHIQLDAEPDATVDAELRRRAFLLPGVEDLPSDRSLPGARGLALSGDLDLARPDVIAGSREFAHFHPDGSLHVWLPVDRAREVHETKWGEIHPWVDRDGFWDGVVMIYTPETLEEIDITIRLLVDAYNFVVGASLEPDDIA